jgi:DNA-binding NarL/FixJ family response regulator
MEPLSILLVDDSPTFLHGLESLLQAEPGITVVGLAMSGQQALALAETSQPAAVIVDLHLRWSPADLRPEELNGLRLIGLLHQSPLHHAVLALSANDERGWLRQVIAAGARGYLGKGASVAQILTALRAAVAGYVVLAPPQIDLLAMDGRETLTARELEVLTFLVSGRNTEQIAQALRISGSTVLKHVENIRGKLGVHSRAEAVAEARRRGLVP